MDNLIALVVGVGTGWGITRFAVAKGWYLAHRTQISAVVSNVKMDATTAASGAQAAARKV